MSTNNRTSKNSALPFLLALLAVVLFIGGGLFTIFFLIPEIRLPGKSYNWHSGLKASRGNLKPVLKELPLGAYKGALNDFPNEIKQRRVILSNVRSLSPFINRQDDPKSEATVYFSLPNAKFHSFAYGAILDKDHKPKPKYRGSTSGSPAILAGNSQTIYWDTKELYSAEMRNCDCKLFYSTGTARMDYSSFTGSGAYNSLASSLLSGISLGVIEYLIISRVEKNIYMELAVPYRSEIPITSSEVVNSKEYKLLTQSLGSQHLNLCGSHK